MLTETDQSIAKEFQRRLMALVPVLDLCVFGSRSRGDATEDSDMDIFIKVERINPELRQRIFDLAWEVGFERDRIISTIVATEDQLRHGAFGANPLVDKIKKEGARL